MLQEALGASGVAVTSAFECFRTVQSRHKGSCLTSFRKPLSFVDSLRFHYPFSAFFEFECHPAPYFGSRACRTVTPVCSITGSSMSCAALMTDLQKACQNVQGTWGLAWAGGTANQCSVRRG